MTNNKQQTAVSWFLDQLLKDGYIKRLPVLQLQQAKEMERQQKRKDFADGIMHGNEPLEHDVIDKWYNKTYGGGEQ